MGGQPQDRDSPQSGDSASRRAQLICARQVREGVRILRRPLLLIPTETAAEKVGWGGNEFFDAFDHLVRLHEAADFHVPLAAEWTNVLTKLCRLWQDAKWETTEHQPDRKKVRKLIDDCIDHLTTIDDHAKGILADEERASTPDSSGPAAATVSTDPVDEEPGAIPSADFNILLLGDLHLGRKNDGAVWKNIKHHFFRDLPIVEDLVRAPWDLVALVGDLSFSGQKIQFDEVDAFIEELWDHCGKKGRDHKLVAVPGNHDLLRPGKTVPTEIEALLGRASGGTVDELLFSQETRDKYQRAIKKRFPDFTAWWDGQQHRMPGGIQPTGLPGEFVAVIERSSGVRLGIMGLNSAYLHVKDMSLAESAASVTPHQFWSAGGADWCKGQHACVLLTHHPPQWLCSKGREQFSTEVVAPHRFAFHACGHCHVPLAESKSQRAHPPDNILVNTALCGMDRFGENEERIHGYTAIRIRVEGRRGTYRFWPRKAQKDLQWKFQPDTDLNLLTDNGTREIPFDSSYPP